MATLELEGFDSLEEAFRRISEIPFDVVEDALDAMAETAVVKIKEQGSAMGVRDPESDVHILDRVVRKKAKKTDFGGYENIIFEGTRTRNGIKTRAAEIAFVNEYGKRSQPARPFIATALAAGENEIQQQAEKVIGDWIETSFQE